MRIITGRAKGLRLKTPAGLATRPTSDRVKESLFSILSGLIDFAEVESVLDIFAGTGALGLEAISRGAGSATFIDMATADIIRDIYMQHPQQLRPTQRREPTPKAEPSEPRIIYKSIPLFPERYDYISIYEEFNMPPDFFTMRTEASPF